MKKILLAAVAALAIVGCTQNEEIENVGNKAEINFGTIVSKTTRAAVTDNTALQGTGFTVYAYNTEKAITDTDTKLGSAFMDGVEVTYPSDSWVVTGGPYYWPYSGKVQFFAYATDAAVKNYKVEVGAKYPTLEYTIAAEASAQKDFVVAKSTDESKPNTNVSVDLQFTHALTQVNFSAKGSNDNLKYTISSISIEGLANTGTYSFANNTWAVTGTAGTYVYPTAGNASVSGTTVTTLDQSKGALMLMPQTMTANSKIKISYNVYNADDVQIDAVTDAEIALNGKDAWEAGKKIRYTLTLSSEGATISFAPEVGPWNTDDDKDTPVTPVTPPAE
jgi:putative uncharacterized protein (fragment)